MKMICINNHNWPSFFFQHKRDKRPYILRGPWSNLFIGEAQRGLFEKFLCYPLSKIGVFDSLYPELLEKNQRNKKKMIFGQFSLVLFRLSC